MRRFLRVIWLWIWAAAMCVDGAPARAQQPPLPVDPTPLSDLLNAREREWVADSKDPKKAVEAYLRVSDERLDTALRAIENGDQQTAERELDVYGKAVSEAGKVAFSARDGKRGMAKKIEQRLYRQIKVLESLERHFPIERLRFAQMALDQAKALRVKALNESFAGGEILKTPPEKSEPHQDSGQWTVDSGQWTGDSGQWIVDREQWTTVGRRQSTVNERWSDGNVRYVKLSSTMHSTLEQIPGDYLNEEEDNHVRQAQQIDERTKVFMKIADRRLAALIPASGQPSDKKAQKIAEEELREWGEVPKASRAELLLHYARAIEECIAKMEDAHERNPKSSAIPKALKMMLDATDRHLPILQLLEPEVKGESEVVALRRALDQARTANEGAREGLKGG